MILLRLLPVFFAALFILTRTVCVRVLKGDKLTVKINFNILAVVLAEDNTKKRGIRKTIRLIKGVRSAFKTFDYLLSKSDVKLFINNQNDIENQKALAKSGYFIASTALIIPYIRTTSRSFRVVERSEQNENSFELRLYFSLWHMIISALIFLYYTVKNKVKRVIKNV